MEKVLVLIVVFITGYIQLSFSQNINIKSGIIITPAGDSIAGSLKYRNSYRDDVEFSASGAGGFTKYTPMELNGFIIEGKKHYVSLEVDSLTKDRIFFITLADGMMSLFFCEDNYFLVRKNGLFYKISRNPDITKKITEGPQESVRTIVIEDKRYIGIFKLLTMDCQNVFNKTDNLQYDIKSFVNLINEYNSLMSPDQESLITNEAFKIQLKIGARGTYLINGMDNPPEDGRYESVEVQTRPGFSAGVATNLSYRQVISFQPELLVTNRRSYLYQENPYGAPPDILNFNLYYLEIPLIIYFTYPSKKVAPSVFAGPVFGFEIADKTDIQTIYSTKVLMDKGQYWIRAGGGVTLKKAGCPFMRFEYFYERTMTNIYLSYHHFANNFSATLFFY